MPLLYYPPKAQGLDSGINALSGAKAYFYVTATSTPKDTYTDYALSVPSTNPVVADANGVFAPIFLKTDQLYRVTLKTSADVTLYTVDNVAGPVATQAEIGLILYPQTPAELSAGVTPTAYQYAPPDIRRYGGSLAAAAATNTTAIQSALDSNGACYLPELGTYSFNGSVGLSTGDSIAGLGERLTTLSYTGAAQAFVNSTPGTRIYGVRLENFTLIDVGTGTVGVDFDSVSESFLENMTVDGFTTGVRFYAASAGFSVYNRAINVKAQNATTGFLIEGLSSNAHVLFACRGNICTLAVDIVDSNENHVIASQFESGVDGVRVTRSTAGSVASNYIESNRFEGNSGTNIIIGHANCADTRLVRNYHATGVQYSDAGTRTQFDDLYSIATGNPMSVQTTTRSSTDGCWKRIRTASTTSIPVYVIGDSATGSGTPDQLHIVNKRGVGKCLSIRDDYYPAGNEKAFIGINGTIGGRHLDLVSADRGDTSQTLVLGTDNTIQRWATNLTANRTVTLSTAGAVNGDKWRIVRTGLGAFNLDVGGLKTIVGALAAFVDVSYDGAAWRLTGYGTL